MTDTKKSKLPNVLASGHPGLIVSLNQSGGAAAHHMILGSTRDGMGAGQLPPQVLDLIKEPNR
jgi:hypothetical protein